MSEPPGCGGSPEYLTIGTITSPRGLAGEVNVFPHTDWPERFNDLSRVFLGAGGRPAGSRGVQRAAVRGPSVVLKLLGVDTREQAEALRGQDLLVPAEEAWPLPEGHYYHFQLLGMAVRDLDGRERGTLVRIYPGPANDFYAVAQTGGSEILIPAVRAVVKAVDLDRRVITVDWPEFGEAKSEGPARGRDHDAH